MPEHPSASVTVAGAGLAADELQFELRSLLDDMARPVEDRQDDVIVIEDLAPEELSGSGIGDIDFASLEVAVVPKEQGWDGQGIDLLVTFTSGSFVALGVETIRQLWERVLRRSLQRRVAEDAVGRTILVEVDVVTTVESVDGPVRTSTQVTVDVRQPEPGHVR